MSTILASAPASSAGADSRTTFGARWFRVAFVVFALGVVAGLLFSGFGPVPFIRALGNAGALAGALGMLVALAGRRHFRRVNEPMPPGDATATVPLAESAPLAYETATTERLPVWPGVTQPT